MDISGLIVPIVTPFNADNQIDVSALEQLLEHFIAEGVQGVVACGTTGEYYALNESERLLVLSKIVIL